MSSVTARRTAWWRTAVWRLGIALLLAPAAALAGAELLVVTRGRLGALPIPSGVHSYLPILTQVGRDRFELGAAAMVALALGGALASGRRSRARTAVGRGRPAGWLLILPLGQVGLLAAQVVALGGLDGVPDALPTTLVALAVEMVVASLLILVAACLGRAALRAVRRRPATAWRPRRPVDTRPRVHPQRVVTRVAFATPTHRGPPARVF